MNKSILSLLFVSFSTLSHAKAELTVQDILKKNYPVVVAVYGLDEWDSQQLQYIMNRSDIYKSAFIAASIPTIVGIGAALIITWQMSK